MKAEPAPGRLPPWKIRSITIVLVLVAASLSGAVVAQLGADQAIPLGIDYSDSTPPAAEPSGVGHP